MSVIRQYSGLYYINRIAATVEDNICHVPGKNEMKIMFVKHITCKNMNKRGFVVNRELNERKYQKSERR